MKRLINKKTLHSMIPLSERTIDAMEKDGKFPRRFALTSRNVVWDADEVENWITQQKESGRQAERPGIDRHVSHA